MSDVNACIVMTSVSDQEQVEKMAKAFLETRLKSFTCRSLQVLKSTRLDPERDE